MSTSTPHQHFSVSCFNETWGLLDLKERSAEQERQMISLTQASFYHWTQREDCTPSNLSVGLWQLARVYAVVNSPQEALRYAKECLEVSEKNKLDAFSISYAHEAIARAAKVNDDQDLYKKHLTAATEAGKGIEDPESSKMLEDDLKGLQ